MTNGTHGHVEQTGNLLLAHIPDLEWQRLRPNFQSVAIPARTILYSRNENHEHVYFPRCGCASLSVDFDDGFQAETGLVGYEGMIGLPLIQGVQRDVAATAVVQLPMEALRVPAPIFARELEQLPHFVRGLRRYGEVMRTQGTQIAACYGHHGLDARLARCILTLQDRHRGRELEMTHEGLAMLLCAHRPSVSIAAKRLQQAGVIRYAAGHLVITDRDGLERAACECYQVLRENRQALLGAWALT